MATEYAVIGTFDQDDRPNVEILYYAKDLPDAVRAMRALQKAKDEYDGVFPPDIDIDDFSDDLIENLDVLQGIRVIKIEEASEMEIMEAEKGKG